MRIHSLEITAMGPFPDVESIDFDRLGEAGIYLLTGRTGSGKTTVLDAISYAIFGKIARNAEGADVVSDHRKLETTPRVVLETTLAGERLRITRSPKHDRPSKRGGGTTEEERSILVEKFTADGWQTVTGNRGEADQLLEAQIGMDADQFNQVVMLPQGEFSRFLESRPRERKELLQQLFPDTDLAWLEKWLNEQAKDARRKRDEKLKEIEDCLHGARPVAAELCEEGEEVLPNHMVAGPVLAWIKTTGTSLERISADREKVREQAKTEWKAADGELRKLTRKSELVKARQAADQELARLERRSEWREDTGAKIALARRAATVESLAKAAAAREAEAAEAEPELNALKALIERDELTTGMASGEHEPRERELRGTASTVSAFIWNELPKLRALEENMERLETELAEMSDPGTDSELGRAKAETDRREEAVRTASLRHIAVREARTRGMAFSLAERLEDGAPCPVCGSLEHPEPAHRPEDYPSEQDESAAAQAERQSIRAERKARNELGRIERRMAERQAAARTELERDRKTHRNLSDRKVELTAGRDGIEDRLDQLEQAADHLKDFLKAERQVENCRSAARKTGREAADAAEKQGFGSIEAALKAALDPENLTRLEGEIGRHDRELAVVREKRDGELKDVDPGERIDLDPAAEKERETAAARDAATGEAEVARNNLRTFRTETDPIPALYEELAPLTEAADRTSELDDLASGRSGRRMNLSIFVLATRLRQVIDVANQHLAGMSDQRYSLVYSGDLADGRSYSGLGIEVLDAYTSKPRPTGTLSGGEKFCAALSLALGLAEVIQDEAAGKALETLFIDEGFGTLDAENLEKVMVVIDSLRKGGRSVGLVSHVEELRNRIPAQIQVIAGSEGSTLKISTS